MRNFIVKYFGRILALLGCTTIVTACYGVGYDTYNPQFGLTGRVVDAETEQPLEGIKVRVVPTDENLKGYPYDATGFTASDGYFDLNGPMDQTPRGYIIECNDVDGELNGSYESQTQKVNTRQPVDLVIKMTPKR